MKFRNIWILVLGFIMVTAVGAVYAGNLNTSGKCPRWAACELGNDDKSQTMTVHGSVFTFNSDTTGNAAVVLPTGSINTGEILDGSLKADDLAENSIKTDEFGAMADKIVVCGDSPNSGTSYHGPAVAEYLGNGTEFAIGGTACSAYDNATEGTADAPINAGFPAFKVTGMYCQSTTDAANDQVLTLRSAAADLTPSVTCTIAGTGAATSCATVTSTTTDIAAGATIAVKEVNTEDLSGADIWCEVYFAIKAL